MQRETTRRLSLVLKWIITFVLAVNLFAIVAVPSIVELGFGAATSSARGYGVISGFTLRAMLSAYSWAYGTGGIHMTVLAVFLQFSGVCTAILLVQARAILHNLCQLKPFHRDNARYMRRAGVCCLAIGGAALARTCWGLAVYSVGMLFTYNTLFIPVFITAGLLCFVMSALFAEASGLKEENDLVI